MSQKITISVSDDLYKKIQQWKESFNYSKIFQDAVSEKIQKKENFKKRLKEEKDMDKIIGRLRKEKDETEQNYYDDGKNEGLEWAKAVYYDDIQTALRYAEDEQEQKSNHNPAIDPITWANDIDAGDDWKEYWKNIVDKNPSFNIEVRNHGWDLMSDSLKHFVSGWVDGVNEFWDEIKDKI